MANMTIEQKVFQLPVNVEGAGTIVKTLKTADTYVDKDIQVTVNVPAATLDVVDASNVSSSFGTTFDNGTDFFTSEETPYALTVGTEYAVGDVEIGAKNTGFLEGDNTFTFEKSDSKSETKYLREGKLAGESSADISGSVSLTQVASVPETGFYVKANASSNVEVESAGWVSPEHTDAVEASAEAIYTIKSASLSNSETGEYSVMEAPVLTEGGYLYINEGYIGNTKVSLADLIPDNANISTENSDLVYNTVKAYDKDGNLIVGTMGDAELGTITANDATANVSAVTVAANNDKSGFNVTGTGTISGSTSVTASKRGLITTDSSQTGVISGTASVNATLDKIGIGVSEVETVVVTPVISKVVDASAVKTGNITTTKPSTPYVAVSTAAITGSVEVTPVVTSAGYGTTDVYSANGTEVGYNVKASGIQYVPIQAATHTVTTSTPVITNATATVANNVTANGAFDGNLSTGILSTMPESGAYLAIQTNISSTTKGSVAGNVFCTTTEGYIQAGTETGSVSGEVGVTVNQAGGTKYIAVYDGTVIEL